MAPTYAPNKEDYMGKYSLVSQVLTRIGKNWSQSRLTREKLLSNSKEFARYVATNYGLERIDHLKPGHVQSYVKSLHERGLSPSTMADKMTAVRVIAAAIGKQNIVKRHNAEYGIQRHRINPQSVNLERLDDVRQAISARADQGNKIAQMVRAADALRVAFGLRAKESLLSSKVELRNGKQYLTIEGAKGGRPRELEVRTEIQKAALQLILETAKGLGSGTNRIIPPRMNLKKAYDAQRNLWRECGGTRAAGANMHGERHKYARERDEQGAARTTIMSELGHGEDRSPAAYLRK
jgi:site-specific recombinase XerC